MAKTAMKSYSLTEMKDKYIGKKSTKDRDECEYEYELRMDILRRMIKTAGQERKLTQEQSGELFSTNSFFPMIKYNPLIFPSIKKTIFKLNLCWQNNG